MPKAQILPNAQTGQISGQFKGEFSGNIWLGKNIDLERSKGRVGLSDSYSHLQHSGQAGFSSLTTPIAFVRSSADNTDRWWANAGVLFKTTGTNPESGWAQDAIASSPTAPLYDLIDFAGNLICPISTDLSRLVAGVWTSAWWSCYMPDTEVLTVNGWKKIQDVKVGEKIYSYNKERDCVEIAVNIKTVFQDYEGEMYHFKNQQIDLMVTPNHRMLVKTGTKRKKNRKWEIKEAQEIYGKPFQLKKSAKWIGENKKDWEVPIQYQIKNKLGQFQYGEIESKKIPIKIFLEFLGYYLSEGSRSENQINIHQSTKGKGWVKIGKNIKTICKLLNLNYGIDKDRGYRISNKSFSEYIAKLIPAKDFYNKKIPRQILELHSNLLIYLYKAMMIGDGDEYGHYYTSSPSLRDDFIELINRLGWSAKYNENNRIGRKAVNGFSKHIEYSIIINKTKNQPCFYAPLKTAFVKKSSYKGKITCLALDKNYVMLVRRNGLTVWCGNTLTGASALQALPHRFSIFESALCFTDGRFINDYDGTVARDPALSLPVGFEARWLLPWRDLLFIGGANTVGREAEVFTWRRSLSLPENKYPIGDSEALCGFVIDVPYIVTLKGAIKKFTGTGFETIQEFPSVELGFNLNGIHPNGAAVTENIAKLLVDMGISNSMRRLSGIYNFDATTKNLYHAGGVRNTAGSDYTQLEVAGYGAIKATVPTQGAYLIGAQPYTIYSGTTRYGIFSSDEENTNNRGYMITPKIPASNVRAYFKYLTAKFQRFDNAGDRIKLLYRIENSLTLPAYETITWVAANQFTGSDANAIVGDFAEIIAGDNAGAIARISAKTASAPFTFTINISLNSSTNAARARYLRFNEIDTVSSQSIQEERAPIADRGNWIQFLIDFIGSETSPQLEKILLEWKDIPV